ncbi:alpha/beta fold hydrolase [Sphingomonas sp.]|uniref:alpha/beta hydrolase family protein n=1 Tax=Sphingomonas sp. TaxID=28214 RepID=UPI001B12A029|nr:alpha/beta fold hydrolase [Sphingomonas sp.]MBO9713735.1 alpha/beta fold hydrolase [Sphingomonas sp.]
MSLFAGFAVSKPALAQAVPDPVGDWNGVLTTPRGGLTLILSISRSPDGSLKADLESPDQGSGKIPAIAAQAPDGQLSVEIKAIGATYKGSWSVADQAWNGTFAQGMDLPLKLVRGLPPARPVIAGLDGVWSAKVTPNGATLRLVLRIVTGPRGTIASLDSPDQLAYGLPVQDLARDGRKIRFRLAVVGASYEGTLSDDGQRLAGTWTAPNRPADDVVFTRGVASAASTPPKRPQTPRPPFPYSAEDVAFDNPAERGVHLAGTLTLPAGKGPFPAAILITGSGQQDRDETLMGHKPFWVIADYLSRRGIAVLRVDDRGAGKSTGEVAKATSADFATDSNAAFAYLRARKDIRPDAIGFIGHSEGGMIGPIAMATNKEVAFLIMMAGPGTGLEQLMLSQRRLIGASMGQSEAELDRAAPVWAALYKAVASGATYEEGRSAALAVLTPEALAAIGVPAGTDRQLILAQLATPWFRYFFRYDPAPNLRAIRVPVLAMNGSLDRQVPAGENLPAIRAALKDDKDVTIVELPGLNHLFQTAKTGAVGEYAEIEETVAPVALEKMASWINARFPAK